MSLRSQLKVLRARRTAELENLQRAARHTRRDISPKRFIRKYPYAALGVAAVAGMLVAPAPKYVKVTGSVRAEKGSSGGSSSWLMGILKKFVPQIAMFEQMVSPGKTEENGTGNTNGHAGPGEACEAPAGVAQTSPLQDIVRQGILILLSRVDIAAVIRAWTEGMKQKGEASEGVAGTPSGEDDDTGFRRPPPSYVP